MASDENNFLKATSLITLTLQNAVLGLSMRYARTRSGPMFFSSTAVVMSELVKFLSCIVLVYKESNSISKCLSSIQNTVIRQPMDTIKVAVPSFVYIIQNNLLYVAASHLDAATYQVTYQLKILTTAIFAVVILKKQLVKQQWYALIVLVIGVAMVQLSDAKSVNTEGQSRTIGFAAAIGACILSGFAGIYFEMILKGSQVSIWMRNIQLSLLSMPFGLLTCVTTDFSKISEFGWFYGYDSFIIYLVVLQAVGGLLVAMVVKYADNILKGFATSLAIVISCISSMYFFNFKLTITFIFGACLVIASIFLYSVLPSKSHDYSKLPQKHKIDSV